MTYSPKSTERKGMRMVCVRVNGIKNMRGFRNEYETNPVVGYKYNTIDSLTISLDWVHHSILM